MIRKLYPFGRKKAFNVTYDDGVLQDVRFAELLNKYNLKGTFNLNSALMENEFEWIHESGLVVKRLNKEDAVSLYKGHEIASHTATHPFMDSLTREEIIRELSRDKMSLEKLFSQPVRGFAVPFDHYSELIAQCVKECGFEYARISEESLCFKPQSDYYNWRATVFHLDESLESISQKFIASDEELAFFQIVGHTYDLDVENKWETIENVFREISACGDILSMTTIEAVSYLRAMSKAEIADGYIKNNSDVNLWFEVDNKVCKVKPDEILNFEPSSKILRTERLILRPWTEADAESLFEYAKNPEVGPVAGWPPHKSIEESLEIIRNVFTGEQCYAICEKENGKAIGAIELKLRGHTDMTNRDDECELGYWLGKPYWGRGYMPEAARELLRHGFEDLHMTTVWCGYYDGNLKSKRVQEKLGFEYHHTCSEVEVPHMNEIRIGHINYMTKERWRSTLNNNQ
ncbi:MAG: GNAT family N-acetyltransferase [Ruminococcus sp.]|nr:GNAT family N-acetyltransferase [Ruminococcus sp.]